MTVQRQGRKQESQELYQRAIAVFETHGRQNDFEYAITLAAYSRFLRATKRSKEAARLWKRAEAIAGDRLRDYGGGLTVDVRALQQQP
jgi:hypothetical protein